MSITLDKKTWKLLKKLYKKKLTYEEVSKITGKDEFGRNLDSSVRCSNQIKLLTRNRFIDSWTGPLAKDGYADEWFGYQIMPEGKSYVEQCKRDFRKTWVPVVVSAVLGLLTFIAALAN